MSFSICSSVAPMPLSSTRITHLFCSTATETQIVQPFSLWLIQFCMLYILLVVAGACIMYNTEYADNAIQRMCTLPTKESTIFFGKTAVLITASIMLLAIEVVSVFFCSVHWFPQSADLYMEILKNFGFFLLLMLSGKLELEVR